MSNLNNQKLSEHLMEEYIECGGKIEDLKSKTENGLIDELFQKLEEYRKEEEENEEDEWEHKKNYSSSLGLDYN